MHLHIEMTLISNDIESEISMNNHFEQRFNKMFTFFVLELEEALHLVRLGLKIVFDATKA